jgi:nucleoside-diphosphate-sugar epimerase
MRSQHRFFEQPAHIYLKKEEIMKIFITGGSGFIGTNLLQYLIGRGHEVANYDIVNPRNVEQHPNWIEGDVRNRRQLHEALSRFNPDYFIHLAARTDLNGKSISDYSSNTDGVLNVVQELTLNKTVQRAIFTSSRLVCKIGYSPKSDQDYCPNTWYGESKVIGEKIVREHAQDILFPWVIIRPTSIWGPWFDTPYKEFFLSVVNSLYIHPKGLRIRKSFGYVGNTVYEIEKILFAAETSVHGKTFFVTDYPPIEVKEWANLIAKKYGTRAPIEVPISLLRIIALCGNILKKLGWSSPPLTSFRLNNIITEMVYSTSELEEICGRLPYSSETGIDLTLEWLANKASGQSR